MKNKTVPLILLSVFSVLLPGYGADFNEIYGDATEFFSFLEDPNTGLTVFPTLTIPLGGEYEGMGTAYTAVARDSSFIDANPAASSLLEFTEISFLHNNWIADTNIEGIVFSQRRESFGYGLAGKFLYVPFTGYDIWGSRVSGGYYSETILIGNVSRLFFPGYYFSGLALGANLKLAYRHVSENIAAGQSAVGVMGDFGALTRFNFMKFYPSRSKNASLGLTVKNLGPNVMDEPLPMSASIGFGYSPLRPILLAADLNLPLSFDADRYPAEKPGFALGASLAMTNFFAVQTGLLVKGGNPRISLGSTLATEALTFVVNYTLDMTTQFTSLDRVSVAVKVNLGDEGRQEKGIRVEEYYLRAIEFFAQGDIFRTIEYCEKALDLDPSFDPARETLLTARRSQELQIQIETRQRLD